MKFSFRRKCSILPTLWKSFDKSQARNRAPARGKRLMAVMVVCFVTGFARLSHAGPFYAVGDYYCAPGCWGHNVGNELFDDGAHGDGAAGDNVSGGTVISDQAVGRHLFQIENPSIPAYFPSCSTWVWTTGPGDAVHFLVTYRCIPSSCGFLVWSDHYAPPGTTFEVIGSAPELGNWMTGVPASLVSGVWTKTITIGAAGGYQFKFRASGTWNVCNMGIDGNNPCGGDVIFYTDLPNTDVRFDFNTASGVVTATPIDPHPPRFDPPSPYVGGGGLGSFVKVGDLNGDGHPDLVLADPVNGGLSVLLNLGNGHFGPSTGYPTGSSPSSVTIGDFNRDGKADLVNSTTDGLEIRLGHGDGTFGLPTSATTGSGYGFVTTADLNGDGKLDVVTSESNLAVLLGNGDGSFAAPQVLGSGTAFSYPSYIVVVDLNEDGKLDLAVGNYSQEYYSAPVSLFFGDGTGGFSAPLNLYADGGFGGGVAVGDVNRDGHPDIVSSGPGFVRVWLGPNWSGNLSTRTFNGATLADIDQDGALDLVGPGVQVRRGLGDGQFRPATTVAFGREGGFGVADLNADGLPDLIYPSGLDTVWIALNHSSSTDVPAHRIASRIHLAQNRPNPMGGSTDIEYHLPGMAQVHLRIYDAAGALVCELFNGDQGPGTHVTRWDRRSKDGKLEPGGIYFYELSASDERLTKRLVLLP